MAKFNEADLRRANARLAMCSFYPSDEAVQAAIMELLAKMCPSLEALQWLTTTMIDRVGVWKGPMELRGVLCWRYKPADGVEANSSLPGFRPEDGEALSLERHAQLKAGGVCEEAMQFITEAKTKLKVLPGGRDHHAA
ncbi:MAG: hypothetical protein KJZ78_18605 [Bryobacteraceae bacterium]|nr:hypothetical protein [Bryobacteraceae bacterium]